MEQKKQKILCHAEDCVYNQKEACTADHIEVNGRNAKTSSQTSCETFNEKESCK